MASVLVVDDDPKILDLVEVLLTRAGHDVRTVPDGEQALATLAGSLDGDWSADLVVLDVMMPGVDGFEVLRRIRDHEWLFDLPVVMLTALDTPDDEATGWFHGCDGYVTKPFSPGYLVDNVEAVLAASEELRVVRRRQRLAELLSAGARTDRR